MNKDQVKGHIEETKGNAKEGAGKLVGNEKLENEGKGQKTAGKIQSGLGGLKEDVKDAKDNFKKKIKDLVD